MKPKVAVVSFPWRSFPPYKFLSDVLKILESLTGNIMLINGNTDRININSKNVEIIDIGIRMHFLRDIKPTFYSAILWIIKCVFAQIKTSFELIKANDRIDVVIFYLAYPYYLLPLIIAKILKKKTIEVLTRSKPNSLLSNIISLQDLILFRLLDGISPETNALIDELDLDRYRNKLLTEGARFIDISFYTPREKPSDRKYIGYVGRIRKEKGVKEFVKAVPIIVKRGNFTEFLIGGSGDLLEWVRTECECMNIEHKINATVTGFIKEKEFPDYLNRLKLLILPTKHAEGLPTIILEAMACGTPVLATPVGGIPTVIKDGETGFIMENSSPKCIAENALRILNYKDLDRIVKKARELIEDEYTYEAAVERYRRILEGI